VARRGAEVFDQCGVTSRRILSVGISSPDLFGRRIAGADGLDLPGGRRDRVRALITEVISRGAVITEARL
jgi:hypothetical protein